MEIIFSKNKWRYTAYLNALLELPYRRRMCIPGAMDLGWERFKWVPLPGGVKMAVIKERKNALTAGEQSQGTYANIQPYYRADTGNCQNIFSGG